MAGPGARCVTGARFQRQGENNTVKSLIGRETVYIMAFFAVAILAFGSVALFGDRLAQPKSIAKRLSDSQSPRRSAFTLPALGDDGRLVLTRGKPFQWDKTRIVYRGISESGRIRIDVVIPELDPDIAYVYRLSMEKAERGFRLAGRKVRMHSASRELLRLRIQEPILSHTRRS